MSARRKRAVARDDFMHAIKIIVLQRTGALYPHKAYMTMLAQFHSSKDAH
jgi:hypothetical protein